MPQLIDLSMPIEPNPADPSFVGCKIIPHGPGGDRIWRELFLRRRGSVGTWLRNVFRFLQDRKRLNRWAFPEGLFLSNEFYTLSVHCGTHMDAPYHFGPICAGQPAAYIHEVPLEWCYNRGVVLDLTGKGPMEPITVRDLERAVAQIAYEIRPYDIVLIRTDYDARWPTREYFTAHPGMTEEATDWLVSRGVRVIGIDTYAFDLPFMCMVQQYLRTGDRKALWPTHMYGRRQAYVHIERMANLRRLPRPYGFQVVCFPISISKAGASWVRPVAIV